MTTVRARAGGTSGGAWPKAASPGTSAGRRARAAPSGQAASAPATRPGVAWVVKVGGSLSGRPGPLRRLMAALAAAGRDQRLVVVPGGGPLADVVRRLDRRFALGDTPAHWMAILAMDQYAHLLAHLAGDAVIVRGPRELRAGRLNVLAPSAWLRRADPLPHSWSVTSDAIAAWVARELGSGGLVVVKDVDGLLAPARPGQRARLRARVSRDRVRGVVDPAFPAALGSRLTCWIVSGLHPERVVALLRTGRTVGTELVAVSRSPLVTRPTWSARILRRVT